MAAIWRRLALLCLLALAACTIQLAPDYDQGLVDGLSQANAETLTLFAELETGSDASHYGEYRPRYAAVIGGFDALRQRAASRAVPPLAKRLSRIPIARDFCDSERDPAACVNASPASLEVVLTTLRKMRDTHQARGLFPDSVAAFRGQYDTAIAQALTVENALKR